MSEGRTGQRGWLVLLAALVVVGGAMMAVGILAGRLGLSPPGTFSTARIQLVLGGLALIVVGLLGQRISSTYRSAALLVLNTLVLLACMELGATLLLGMQGLLGHATGPYLLELPYYASQDWAGEYWQDFSDSHQTRYDPWVIWRRPPFERPTINVDQQGVRQTPGANCGAGSYKVFAFGGSAMWGMGSPDWGTIPAYLQAGLEQLMEGPVCVVNFGESGYVSTQNVIELIVQLQSGNVPDLVMFYDGVNDVYAAYQSGEAGVHQNLSQIVAKFEGRGSEHPLLQWLKGSSSFALAERLVTRLGVKKAAVTYKTMGVDAETLADDVVEAYLGNHEIVGALAQEYGFEYHFFWQPVIFAGDKPLTEDEQKHGGAGPALVDLLDAVYHKVEGEAPRYENLYYLGDAFDEEDSQIWIDWKHITPEGNELVARRMLDVITGK